MSVLAAWVVGAGVLTAHTAPAEPAAVRDEGPVYAFGLRAAAAEPFVRAGRELPFAAGFSHVELARGSTGFRCDAVAAAYWLGVYEERGPLYSPDDPNLGHTGPLGPNPTAARVSRPTRAQWPDQAPLEPGAAATRTASCDDAGTTGRATGAEIDSAVRLGGSAALATIDAAGRFTGNGRAYVQGLGPSAGALDAMSSVVAVTATPGDEPKVTYRLTLVRADVGGGARSEFDQTGVSLAGRDVPVGGLVRQFQDQLRDRAHELAAFGTLGVTVLEPVVTTQDGLLAVTAPAVAVAAGVTVFERYLGREQGVRLGAVTYSSRYPLRPKEPHL